jgi:hypothetical protein
MFHGANSRQGGEDAQDDEYEAAGHITHTGHDPEIDRTGCFFSSAQNIDPMGAAPAALAGIQPPSRRRVANPAN